MCYAPAAERERIQRELDMLDLQMLQREQDYLDELDQIQAQQDMFDLQQDVDCLTRALTNPYTVCY